MCGILGMIGPASLTPDALDALFILEHRGRNSSGMCGYNTETGMFSLPVKGKGSSNEVFKEFDSKEHAWQGVIGHNRYATSGSDIRRDGQPLLITNPPIAIAHNGQIVNLLSLRQKYEDRWTYVTSCDVEHIQFCLAENLLERKYYKAASIDEFVEEKLFPSIEAVLQDIKGAYSVVGIIGKKGLFAFKDQHGIRPLSYGKKQSDAGTIHAFVSESSALQFLHSYSDVREMEPGEAVFISFAGKPYERILKQGKAAFCSFEPVYFSYPNSVLLGQYVHDIRERLGQHLAEQYAEFKERIDHVTDSPKTAIPAAISLAWAWSKPYGGLFARGDTRSFLEPDQLSRDEEIRRKLVFIPSAFRGKRVAVVDDSIVRGSTSRRVVRLFREAGAREVHIFSTFPQIISPCIYGIDTPDEDELIAARYEGNPEKIAAEICADSVNFLSIDNLVKALGGRKEELCLACLNKDYPSGRECMDEYITSRKEERLRMKV